MMIPATATTEMKTGDLSNSVIPPLLLEQLTKSSEEVVIDWESEVTLSVESK